MTKVRQEIVLKDVIASFPHLDEPRAIDPNSTPKYGIVAICTAAQHMTVLQEIKQHFDRMVQTAFPEAQRHPQTGQYVGIKPLPIALGRDKYPNNPWYADKIMINMSSKFKPPVFGPDAVTPLDPSVIYPGCIVAIACNMYDYNWQGQRGITFGVTAIQFRGDGERLDDRPDPTTLFEAVETARADAAANPFAAPATPPPFGGPVAPPQQQPQQPGFLQPPAPPRPAAQQQPQMPENLVPPAAPSGDWSDMLG